MPSAREWRVGYQAALRAATPPPMSALLPADIPAPGTPEFGRMNQERAELIRKKVRGELTEAERVRYESLQSLSLAAIEQPRSAPAGPRRSRLRDLFRGGR